MKKIFLLIFLIVLSNSVFAITAESSSYSLNMHGTGIAASSIQGDYEARSVFTVGSGTKNSGKDEFTVNIGFFNGVTPYQTVSINSFSIYPKSATVVSIIRFSISAVNEQNVWAEITRPDGIMEELDLENNDYTYYTAGIIGRYNVTFYANTSNGAVASAVDYFDITDVISVSPPNSESSSGGGGGGGSCNYVWDCSPWSICQDGIQTRQCTNIGSCTGILGKPAEEVVCSEQLFDISVKLDNMSLSGENKLFFGVNMTEMKGKDKIDVYIKYSIIKNNTEIYSQIETRAIEGNLTYFKEINDVSLNDGDYVLRVDILYGYLQRAFAEQRFNVKSNIISFNEGSIEPKITGNVVYPDMPDIFNKDAGYILLTILIVAMIFLIRDKIRRILSKILSIKLFTNQKYPENSVSGLIGKKVYTSNGNYFGKVEDVTIEGIKIDSLKIKVDKMKDKARGFIINWKHVISCGEIITIDSEILKFL